MAVARGRVRLPGDPMRQPGRQWRRGGLRRTQLLLRARRRGRKQRRQLPEHHRRHLRRQRELPRAVPRTVLLRRQRQRQSSGRSRPTPRATASSPAPARTSAPGSGPSPVSWSAPTGRSTSAASRGASCASPRRPGVDAGTPDAGTPGCRHARRRRSRRRPAGRGQPGRRTPARRRSAARCGSHRLRRRDAARRARRVALRSRDRRPVALCHSAAVGGRRDAVHAVGQLGGHHDGQRDPRSAVPGGAHRGQPGRRSASGSGACAATRPSPTCRVMACRQTGARSMRWTAPV